MKRFLLLITVIICITLTGCTNFTKTEEETEIVATVTNLEISETNPTHYWVTVSYDDISHTFDNKNLYENVEEGTSITMVLYSIYDKNHNIISQELYFPVDQNWFTS